MGTKLNKFLQSILSRSFGVVISSFMIEPNACKKFSCLSFRRRSNFVLSSGLPFSPVLSLFRIIAPCTARSILSMFSFWNFLFNRDGLIRSTALYHNRSSSLKKKQLLNCINVFISSKKEWIGWKQESNTSLLEKTPRSLYNCFPNCGEDIFKKHQTCIVIKSGFRRKVVEYHQSDKMKFKRFTIFVMGRLSTTIFSIPLWQRWCITSELQAIALDTAPVVEIVFALLLVIFSGHRSFFKVWLKNLMWNWCKGKFFVSPLGWKLFENYSVDF